MADGDFKARKNKFFAHLRKQDLPDFHRPMVLFDLNRVKQGHHEIPEKLLKDIKETPETVQRAAVTADDLHRFSLSHGDRARFNRGEPLILAANVIDLRPKLKRGGQALDPHEEAIKTAFYVVTFVVIERLRHLLALERPNTAATHKKPRSLEEVCEKLLPVIAEELADNGDGEHHLKMLGTAMQRGKESKLWLKLFSCDNLRAQVKIWALKPDFKDPLLRREEWRFQMTQFISMLLCRKRAKELRQVEEAIGREALKGRDANRGQAAKHAAADFDGGAGRLFAAAYAGDINPSHIFFRFQPDRENYDLLRLLGRAERGLAVTLTVEQEECLAEWRQTFMRRGVPTSGARDVMSMEEFLPRAIRDFDLLRGDATTSGVPHRAPRNGADPR